MSEIGTVSSCSRAGKIEHPEEKWGIATLIIRRLRFLTITIYDAVLNTPMKVEIRGEGSNGYAGAGA
jgi:hypothetical protein